MRESRNERVPVALPAEQVAAVRRVVDAGAAESVAAYVAEAVRGRLARDRALARLNDLYARRGVTLRPEHHAWARRALGVDPGPGVGGGPGAATA
jgi:Arc/MetJ-type ribon-helix-helix transcriptional regulator